MSRTDGEGSMLTALGMMSGTSMDGIDVALLVTDGGDRVERGPFSFTPYPAALRRRIEAGLEDAKAIRHRAERPGSLGELEAELTDLHATAVRSFLAEHGIRADAIDLIGAHGQTVLHRPKDSLTVQLLDGAALARALGTRVVHDVRQSDVEMGGQGAPLVPVYHRALANSVVRGEEGETVAFLNIGGISNLTIVRPDELLAFDCGPGNALIDTFVQREAGVPFDDGGRIAGEGEADEAFIDRMLDRPFFRERGPKSLDRLDFELPDNWTPELSDGARTLTRLTARAVALHLPLLPDPPSRWIVSGGGARNATMLADLRELLAPATVRTAEEVGLNGDAMEAEAWAFLAVRMVKGLPISEPGTTGRRAFSDRERYAAWL